jgi:hypothetical protein
LAVALIQMLLLTVGCTSACPAVGWFDELKIEITGSSAGAVDRLEVCFAGSCYSGGSVEPGESGSTLETVAVTKTGTGWTLTTPMQTPDTIRLRAFSVSGHLLAEHEVDLRWKRVGGSVRCGGPHEANTSISVGS